MTYRKLRKEFNDYFDSIKDSYLNKKITVEDLDEIEEILDKAKRSAS